MRERTKVEIKEIVREVLKEEKLVGSGGYGLWWWNRRTDDKYVEGVVSKLNRMEDFVKKLRDLTKADKYEYVEEKKLKKKPEIKEEKEV